MTWNLRRGAASGGLAIVLLAACGGGPSPQATTSPSPRGGWRVLPSGPLPADASVRAVWSGNEMLLWGSDRSRKAVGAAYAPATESWRELPPSGLSRRYADGAVVWTGSEMVVWGGIRDDGDEDIGTEDLLTDGAAFNPAQSKWRRLSQPPFEEGGSVGAAVWTGSHVAIMGLGHAGERASGVLYHPDRDRWRSMSKPPVAPIEDALWTGDRILVWAGKEVATYDPATDEWRRLAPSPLKVRTGAHVAWTGTELVVWGGRSPHDSSIYGDGGIFDPAANAWRRLPPSMLSGRFAGMTVWAGDRMIVLGGSASTEPDAGERQDGAAFHPSAGWEALESSPLLPFRTGSRAVWTGTDVLIWSEGKAASYRPS